MAAGPSVVVRKRSRAPPASRADEAGTSGGDRGTSKASGNLLGTGAAVPGACFRSPRLPDTAARRGRTATTCRFLAEAPPLGEFDRSGRDHDRQFTTSAGFRQTRRAAGGRARPPAPPARYGGKSRTNRDDVPLPSGSATTGRIRSKRP